MNIHYILTYNILISTLILLAFLCIFLPSVAFAAYGSRVDIPSSPNPVGSGARALGMGGAFIAVADDATAASWNPGGLIQLEIPEISIVGAYFDRSEDLEFGTNPEASGSHSVSNSDINYFSLAYPFALLNRNMIVSLNYQHLIDFTRNVDYYLLSDNTGAYQLDSANENSIDGKLSAIGLAYAVQVTPSVSLGFTFNIWDDWLGSNGWEKTNHEKNTGVWSPSSVPPFLPFPDVPMHSDFSQVDKYSFSGLNANIGFLWNINSHLTFGAVIKTPFTANLRHEKTTQEYTYIETTPITVLEDGIPWTTITDEELDMPMSYGIGVSYRFSDQLTVSADIYRTEWQDFVKRDSNGMETSATSGLPISQSDIDPTTQVRIGTEYLIIKPKYVIPLRGGIFYDPAPAEGSPDDFFGFSLGSGLAYGNYIFDVAYQYRFGNNVGGSILQSLDFSEDVKEHTVYMSFIYHFDFNF